MKRLLPYCIAWLLALALAPALAQPDVRRLADLPYGPDAAQRMDVYLPPSAHGAPVLVMVHGGAWTVSYTHLTLPTILLV